MTITPGPRPAASPVPPEPASGRGRSHGTSSKDPFDRWFRYPAGFASDYAGVLLGQLGITNGLVIDPFAGSGVTGTAARERGLDFLGIEAHPLIADLATRKMGPGPNGKRLLSEAQNVVKAARQCQPAGSSKANADLDGETDLIRRSFTKEALNLLIAMRDSIKALTDTELAGYLKWALLGTLRDVAVVKVGWPYQRPGEQRRARYSDPTDRFESRVAWIADDVSLDLPRTTASIVCGDSSSDSTWAGINAIGRASVSSPPYLNNFDYADATRLELYFWGEASTWKEMCTYARRDMLTATTQQSSVGEKTAALARLEQTGRTGEAIAELTEALHTARHTNRDRGKEYDQVAPAYFAAMADVLRNLSEHLDLGSRCVWLIGDSAPYGVYIDTPGIIGRLASDTGFTVLDDVVLRERGNRWAAAASRHKVPLAERLLVFERTD